MMDQGPRCYIPKCTEINPLVPKKIFKAFLPYMDKKPYGHVINIILTYFHFLVHKKLTYQKFGKKGQVVSEKNKFLILI